MLRVFPDLPSLTRSAADLFLERLGYTAETSPFRVALSGGETPEGFYRLLASDPFLHSIPWKKVQLFWGDERCVPSDDPRSNERMARRALVDHVPIPPTQVYPIRCEGSAREAARRYGRLLQSLFGLEGPSFDWVLLGLGEDGHTASLFPGSHTLLETTELALATEGGDPDLPRVTLTLPAINRSACVVFLVSGDAKAAALHAVLEGERDSTRWPAQHIRPQAGDLFWLVDEAAASRLDDLSSLTSQAAARGNS